ncbi:Speckle-type POZ protein [Araneus ventricosus]|uniref:Speckle-type POZ protein n=1 Tax=Araneus ventricosus TaxID=182803 RepID=A0A4Y2T784_ARAVE|nr:Speckle-type POZ protein [Araneus ventricosus]
MGAILVFAASATFYVATHLPFMSVTGVKRVQQMARAAGGKIPFPSFATCWVNEPSDDKERSFRMARERECFEVTWRIENYNFYQSSIQSPSFVINSVDNISWFFEIAPKSVLKKDHISFHAQRKVGDSLGIYFKTSFFTYDGSSPLYEGDIGINSNMLFSSACYVPHSEVYAKKRGAFLPPKTLTIRCRMNKARGYFSEVGQCFARTRIQVVRTAFIGFAEDFSDLVPGKKRLAIKSFSTEEQLLNLNLSLGGDLCCKEKVRIEIIPLKKDYIKYCLCELFLLDSEGKKTECGRNEITFSEREPQKWEFPLYFTKDYLMKKNTQFLPDDTLTLKCEFAFSTGIGYEGIEDSEFGNLVPVDKNQSKFPSALEELTCLYKEGTLCDIVLQTETETFNAHKIILSARSSVFKTMFTTDMREKTTDCVIIEDLDADTVRRMLLYLYSDTLEDLDWEKAKSLYFAADKYNIAGLKHRCSGFLKSSLQPLNYCELLSLADRHQDEDLKKSVQEYIANFREEIFRSDQWMNFEKSNPELAIETFRAVYLGN